MKIYTYNKCSTCRKAIKWLNEQNLAYEEIAIRENPPSLAELQQMLSHTKDLKKLFNSSGKDYRELKIKDKFANSSEKQLLELLAKNGNLVKRPFLLSENEGIVGFKEETWAQLFNKS